MSEFQFGGEFVWHPTPELVAQSNLQRFIEKHELGSYDKLMRRSTTDIAWFWDAVLSDLDIQFYKPYSRVVDLSEGKPWARWCIDGEMNIVHNMLDKYTGTEIDNRIAIKSETEDGGTRTLTYKTLRVQTNEMAAALRTLGLGKGDAIGVFMPMVPEIVIAMLAIIKIGGIFLPLFSGFGPAAIVSRLNDAEAKALFTADGTYRRGKFCAMKAIADEAASQVSTMKHLIVLDQKGDWIVRGYRVRCPQRTFVGFATDSEHYSKRGANCAHIGGRSDDDHLHFGHHRPAKRRGAFPLRVSNQIRTGHAARARSASGRNAFLDD